MGDLLNLELGKVNLYSSVTTKVGSGKPIISIEVNACSLGDSIKVSFKLSDQEAIAFAQELLGTVKQCKETNIKKEDVESIIKHLQTAREVVNYRKLQDILLNK